MAKIERISKKYTRSINVDRQIWTFATELSASVEVASKEDLLRENDTLFAQAKKLTERDIKKWEDEVAAEKASTVA